MDIDRFFMGMATQMSEREDHLIVQDLRGIVLLKVFHSFKLKKTIAECSEWRAARRTYRLAQLEQNESRKRAHKESKSVCNFPPSIGLEWSALEETL